MKMVTEKRNALTHESSRYDALVIEALDIHRALSSATQFGDAQDLKLSPQAYLAEALKNARTTSEKLREAEARLARDQEKHPHIDRFIDGVYEGAVTSDDSCYLRPISGNLHMAGHFSLAEFTNVVIEAMRYQTNPFELVAIAVLQATEQHPEMFGQIKDWDAHHEQVDKQWVRLAALWADIPQAALDGHALAFHHVGGEHWRLTFKWQGEDTRVVISPDAEAGASLIGWCVAR